MSDSDVPAVTPPDAHAILQRDPTAVLLDVRTKMEFDYVGHPIGAIHVPWQEAPGQPANPNFVAEVRTALQAARGTRPEDTTVLTLCRSGARSRAAAEALIRHGFGQVYNVDEGFEGDKDSRQHRSTVNGWRFHGLPWEQT